MPFPLQPSTWATLKQHGLLLLISLIYGLFFPLLKLFCHSVAPLDGALLRQLAFALMIIALGWLWNGGLAAFWRVTQRHWRLALLNAVLGTLYIQLMAPLALQYTSAFYATLLMGCIPLITAVLTAALGWERLTRKQYVGLSLGMGGMAALLLLQLGPQADGGSLPWLGNLIIFSNACCFSIYALVNQRLLREHTPSQVLAATFLWSGGLTALGIGALQVGWPQAGVNFPHLLQVLAHFGPLQWGLFAYIAVVAGLVGYWLHNRALASGSANQVATYTLLQPLWSAMAGWWLLNEHFTWAMALAAGVLVWGVRLAASPPAKG
jgi:drug/metabolite transporter (DMT)-like permease